MRIGRGNGPGLVGKNCFGKHPSLNSENDEMRTNLKVSFAEKDKVKALGARWDPALKVWYVENAPDLTRFAAWIPALAEQQPQKSAEKKPAAVAQGSIGQRANPASLMPSPSNVLPDCGCDALPWEHCEHTISR